MDDMGRQLGCVLTWWAWITAGLVVTVVGLVLLLIWRW